MTLHIAIQKAYIHACVDLRRRSTLFTIKCPNINDIPVGTIHRTRAKTQQGWMWNKYKKMMPLPLHFEES